MADRQTALAVFDFLDSLRAGQYRIGADAEKDHATAGLLASLSGDTGLRDAVCAKLISPGLERARFLMVAEHDPRALPLFASGQVKPCTRPTTTCARSPTASSTRTYPHCCGGCPTPSRIPREGGRA